MSGSTKTSDGRATPKGMSSFISLGPGIRSSCLKRVVLASQKRQRSKAFATSQMNSLMIHLHRLYMFIITCEDFIDFIYLLLPLRMSSTLYIYYYLWGFHRLYIFIIIILHWDSLSIDPILETGMGCYPDRWSKELSLNSDWEGQGKTNRVKNPSTNWRDCLTFFCY